MCINWIEHVQNKVWAWDVANAIMNHRVHRGVAERLSVSLGLSSIHGVNHEVLHKNLLGKILFEHSNWHICVNFLKIQGIPKMSRASARKIEQIYYYYYYYSKH